MESRWRHLIPWDWSYECLWVTWWGLGIEPGFSVRAASGVWKSLKIRLITVYYLPKSTYTVWGAGEALSEWSPEGCVLLTWANHVKDHSLRPMGKWQKPLPTRIRLGVKRPSLPSLLVHAWMWTICAKMLTIVFSPPFPIPVFIYGLKTDSL